MYVPVCDSTHYLSVIMNIIVKTDSFDLLLYEYPISQYISRADRLKKRACITNISLYTYSNAIVIDTIFSNFSWFGSNPHCRHHYYF